MDKQILRYTYRCILDYVNILCRRAGMPDSVEVTDKEDSVYEMVNEAAERFVTNIKDERNDASVRLKSIFNKLNDGNHNYVYPVTPDGCIVYPVNSLNDDCVTYKELVAKLIQELNIIEKTEDNVNLVFDVIEKYMSFIPYNTTDQENLDISAFDGLKIKCAIMACIIESLKYDDCLLDDFMNKAAFILFSADISGIQKFIYRIRSKGALKSLRSRSFFLEIFMEHVIDEVLEGCGVTRANLIYSGGGHCYIILPNNIEVIKYLENLEEKISDYLCRNFNISLFFACGYISCSGNNLINKPARENPYKQIFINLRKIINKKKSSRYTPQQLRLLNRSANVGYKRECSVCGAEGVLKWDLCNWCSFFTSLSSFLRLDYLYITITNTVMTTQDNLYIEVPSINEKRYMVFSKEKPLVSSYVRVYLKNAYDKSMTRSIKFLICDYAYSDLLEDMKKDSPGIEKVGIYRGDVDNLGLAFISGFDNETLARAASFSRRMSVFFKKYIIGILDGTCSFRRTCLLKEENKKKKVIVIYSGGDDVFIIGHWVDALEAAVDIRECFNEYTSGSLTISGGLKLVNTKYPLKKSADESAELESVAKNNTGKNSICVIEPAVYNTFNWNDFKSYVIEEKLKVIRDYCESTYTGNSFLYNVLSFLEICDEKINIARYAYLLARQAPDKKSNKMYPLYQKFDQYMMAWVHDKKDRNELITALRIYLYINRKES